MNPNAEVFILENAAKLQTKLTRERGAGGASWRNSRRRVNDGDGIQVRR